MDLSNRLEMEAQVFSVSPTDTITQRPDGSYVLNDIYHIPDNTEFHDKYEIVKQAIVDGHAVTILPAASEIELLEAAKAAAFFELKHKFEYACDTAIVEMDGVVYDANETANRNVAGLLELYETAGDAAPVSIQFCAHDNTFHNLGMAAVKRLRLLIIEKGQQLYQQKWVMRSAIEAAQTQEELASVQIVF